MKKYKIVLSLCFISLCGLVSFKTIGNITRNDKVEKRIQSGKDWILSGSLQDYTRKETTGWEILFDGKNTDKWRSKKRQNFSVGWMGNREWIFGLE